MQGPAREGVLPCQGPASGWQEQRVGQAGPTVCLVSAPRRWKGAS